MLSQTDQYLKYNNPCFRRLQGRENGRMSEFLKVSFCTQLHDDSINMFRSRLKCTTKLSVIAIFTAVIMTSCKWELVGKYDKRQWLMVTAEPADE